MVSKKKRALKRAAAMESAEKPEEKREHNGKAKKKKQASKNKENEEDKQAVEKKEEILVPSKEENGEDSTNEIEGEDSGNEVGENSGEDSSSSATEDGVSEDENDNEESEEEEDQQDINIEFEAESPFEEDFHGVKQLLLRVLLNLHIDVSELSDLIINQKEAGSTIKIADQEDSEVYGLITALSLQKYKEKPCIRELKKEILEKAKSVETKKQFENILNEKNVAFLINERFLNIPGQIAAPCHQSLLNEVEESQSEDSSYKFDYLLLISKTLKSTKHPVGEKSSTSKMKKKNKTSDEVLEYSNFEDELFHKACALSFDYCVTDLTGLAVGGGWDFEDTPMDTYRTVMLVDARKWPAIVREIQQLVDGT